ncbi:MAG: gliding motility-associated C-terminal domain-containing protein [Bacteroidota bacterium]|nr:gliding motility-associated C-terminal domain-containing protein [Bacteroidota bacterium]
MRKALLIVVLYFSIQTIFASHIVGGEMMYTYAGRSGNNYLYNIKLFVYFDCKNAMPGVIDSDINGITIHVFDNSNKNSAVRALSKQNITGTDEKTIADLNYNCIKTKPNQCVVRYTFNTQVSLPPNSQGYTITFERCCRNEIIDNIRVPSSTGATYWTEIKDVRLGNSSPEFVSLPPNFLCTNAPLRFDHNAKDINGDSLVYELYHPFLGGDNSAISPSGVKPDIFNLANNKPPTFPFDDNSRKVAWQNAYSTNMQIDGLPTLTINRNTGKLSLTPNRTGNYVVGIRVLEYRNGVIIGETKRDFQFNVSDCTFEVVSAFFIPQFSCANQEVNFQNRSIGGTEFYWDFGDPSSINNNSTIRNPKYTYNAPGKYKVKLITKTNLCSDTSDYEITIKEAFKAKLPNDTIFCGEFTQTIQTNVPNKQYLWNTGETSSSITINKGGTYIVTVTDQPCVSKDTMIVLNDLSKLDLGPDSVICRDSFVQFTYKGKTGYKQYLWNDNTTKQSVFISKLGTYKLSVINQNNCPLIDSITFVLYPPPRSRLRDTMFCEGTSVILDGTSYHLPTLSETNYIWNSGQTTPTINVSNPGEYIITLKNKLCTIFDTAILDYYFVGLDLGPDTFYCGPVDRLLSPQYDYVSYLWNNEIRTKTLRINNPGLYYISIITKEGCFANDSIRISQFPPINGGLGDDTTICLSSRFNLFASDSMTEYLWNTGSNTRDILVTDAGIYSVWVKNKNGCEERDTIEIFEDPNALPSELFMPNAFTPNDDITNDFYPGNKYTDPGADYLFRIFNRWGEKIFESENPNHQWDGKIKGNIAQQDVYVFYVKYVACDEIERSFRGTFHLIR